jgi:hypothetical protein
MKEIKISEKGVEKELNRFLCSLFLIKLLMSLKAFLCDGFLLFLLLFYKRCLEDWKNANIVPIFN